jgi:hypothetical protein
LQTVSNLRRKLGDPANDSRILMYRRGYGYAVMIDHSDDSGFPALTHLVAAAVNSRVQAIS